ncbi:MAG: hypothetical protein P1P82_07095 [Bacteroidales bacterium]|nr:hypothetical protein [Bacteroidales bacterium]MDT8432768.1 hypothetical protein [Bacteroidales bacterium]
MGFADRYLQKHATGNPLILSAPNPGLHSIIAIPAYNESGLTNCLDSLFSCVLPDAPSEVIVLVNSGEQTPHEIIALNRNTYRDILNWCASRQRPGLTFHTILLENLPGKHFGAGLARKLVMDEAVRRFNQVDHAAGIILSLDGDTLVDQDYLAEVTGLFDRTHAMDGCSVRFAHPLDPPAVPEDQKNKEDQEDQQDHGILNDLEVQKIQEAQDVQKTRQEQEDQKVQEAQDVQKTRKEQEVQKIQEAQDVQKTRQEQEDQKVQEAQDVPKDHEVHPAAVYDAIVNYELHQRYYLEAVRYTGYPHAYHTVGSAFAVRAGAYCRQGGMSKRQAGEDFYFIQKVAMQGNFSECNTTTVHPSPRPSDRVPFGTGPAIARQLETPGEPFLTYAPLLFQHLHDFYALIPGFFATGPPAGNARQSTPAETARQKPQSDTAEENTTIAGRPAQHNFQAGLGQREFYEAIQAMLAPLSPLLQDYLEKTGFLPALTEIHCNVASEPSFRQRFYRKFNMFWILKYLHFAVEQGVNKEEVGEAARELLEMKKKQMNRNAAQGSSESNTARKLLEMKGGKVAADADREGLPGETPRELLAIYRKVQAVPSKK